MTHTHTTYRSLLFVPGNRPDRFDKACQSGADLVCIDLEDAVGAADKAEARTTTLSWLTQTPYTHVGLRINPSDSPVHGEDVDALCHASPDLPFVMIPKCDNAGSIAELDRILPSALGNFFVIIESARGLVFADEILKHERVKMAIYGSVDYAGDVGCGSEWEHHLYARSRLVASANCFDVTLFDTPHIDVRNLEDCARSTEKARDLGIFARSAIHPTQIPIIHQALAPSDEDIAWAERVIAADIKSQGNVTLLDGKFIEAPVVKAAHRILARATQ